jgi:FkbM family methyltransferase
MCLAQRNEERRTFYVVKKIDSVSLYPPAENRMSRWRHRRAYEPDKPFEPNEVLALARTTEIATRTLDSWHEEIGRPEIDFLKLDVQGAELEILLGGREALSSVLGVESEVEFVPQYHGQPLFADIDSFLRGEHFTFYNLQLSPEILHYAGRKVSPIHVVLPPNPIMGPQGAGQFFASNALYLRDPLDPLWPADRVMPVTKQIKLAIIAEATGQLEYAMELVISAIDRLRAEGDETRATQVKGAFDRAVADYNNAIARGG